MKNESTINKVVPTTSNDRNVHTKKHVQKLIYENKSTSTPQDFENRFPNYILLQIILQEYLCKEIRN